MKHIFFLIIVIFFISCKTSSIIEVETEIPESEVGISHEAEDKSIPAWNKLINYIRAQSDNEKYPEFYGGGFINPKGEITVYLTEQFNKNKTDLSKYMAPYKINFMKADFSWNELESVMHIINSKIVDNIEIFNVLEGWRIEDSKNRIIITLKSDNQYYIEEFKTKIYNAPCLIFEYTPEQGELD